MTKGTGEKKVVDEEGKTQGYPQDQGDRGGETTGDEGGDAGGGKKNSNDNCQN